MNGIVVDLVRDLFITCMSFLDIVFVGLLFLLEIRGCFCYCSTLWFLNDVAFRLYLSEGKVNVTSAYKHEPDGNCFAKQEMFWHELQYYLVDFCIKVLRFFPKFKLHLLTSRRSMSSLFHFFGFCFSSFFVR